MDIIEELKKYKNINWFYTNYPHDDNKMCLLLLKNALRIYSLAIDDIYKGLIELRKATKGNTLASDIQILGTLTNYGINSSIAGMKLKEALLMQKQTSK